MKKQEKLISDQGIVEKTDMFSIAIITGCVIMSIVCAVLGVLAMVNP